MKNVLVHRGPDDEGSFFSTVKLPDRTVNVGLGHRRLSIIDLSANAKQPMSNENHQIQLTYNGEIYNFIELRDRLKRLGHVFKSVSDTEVIIHGYEEWGTSCLDKFNGMFAFALWDGGKKQLFCARDRLGIKPLYYYHNGDTFAFASELKALLQIKDIPRQLDYQSVSDYLSWQFVPAPQTIFRHIKKLLPAHYLILTEKGLSRQRYWNVREFSDNPSDLQSEYYEQHIRSILTDSVKKRMISDVRLGAFLSGGLDSSMIVGLMSRNSVKPTRTFTIGFDSEEYTSELEYAGVAARAFATEHHEEILSVPKLIDLLPKLVWFMDEPFADHSMVPTYLVSQLAGENVTVALSGDGADENFAGYPRRYRFALQCEKYQHLPDWLRITSETLLRKALHPILSFIPDSKRKKRLCKFLSLLSHNGIQRVVTLDSIITPDQKQNVLHREVIPHVRTFPAVSGWEGVDNTENFSFQQVLNLDIENYLVNDILTKVDRMSMANSLEVRVPFLDHRLVEFAATIGARLKLKGRSSKYILKKALEGIVPGSILQRPKQGFGIPVALWMREDLLNFSRQALLDPSVRRYQLINETSIHTMLDSTTRGTRNYSRELWMVMMLHLWCLQYLD